ncbi:MAG: ABC transporter ATP-binding protein [Gemmatimonadaceae bacterium]
MLAVRAERLCKRYRIPKPGAAGWKEYLRNPRLARQEGRSVAVDALRDVSFDVPEGEVFGIIGRNGAGKSTLLKILSRITTPTSGRATMRGRVASLLEVGTGFHPELTGRENVLLNGMLLGMPRREVERVFDEIVEFAGVATYIDTPIKRYSTGMQLRLAFAVAAHLAADTIIVDEVLAVGDAEFQEKCARTMRASTERGRTTLFVSHNLALVENLCTRAMLLERGQVTGIGSSEAIVRQYLRGAMDVSAACVDYVAPERESASRACWIRAARMRGTGEAAPIQGEDALVTIDIAVRDPVRQLELWIGISTVEGERVAALNSSDYRHEWTLQPGQYRIEIRLPELRLLPRRYATTLRLQQRTGDVHDDVVDGVVFPVLERDVLGTGVALLGDRGVTWIPALYEIQSMSRSPALTEV